MMTYVTSLNGCFFFLPVPGLVSPEGIAVDWVGRNIYFTDSELDVVAVARVDGSYMKTLFRDNLVNPRAIVADPRRGLVPLALTISTDHCIRDGFRVFNVDLPQIRCRS